MSSIEIQRMLHESYQFHSYWPVQYFLIVFSSVVASIKGTLTQIWNSPYIFVFIWKEHPQRLLLSLSYEFSRHLFDDKSRPIFILCCCFWMFISCACISKRKRCFNVKSYYIHTIFKTILFILFSTYYFHMKTKILADFQICISVHLKLMNHDINNVR